jgi:hypothetical protein
MIFFIFVPPKNFYYYIAFQRVCCAGHREDNIVNEIKKSDNSHRSDTMLIGKTKKQTA